MYLFIHLLYEYWVTIYALYSLACRDLITNTHTFCLVGSCGGPSHRRTVRTQLIRTQLIKNSWNDLPVGYRRDSFFVLCLQSFESTQIFCSWSYEFVLKDDRITILNTQCDVQRIFISQVIIRWTFCKGIVIVDKAEDPRVSQMHHMSLLSQPSGGESGGKQ